MIDRFAPAFRRLPLAPAWAFVLVPAVRAGGMPEDANERPPSLCAAGERIWFSATLVDTGERVSLCGPAASDDARGLQFRLGRPGAASFVHPRTPGDPVRSFVIRRYTRPLTTYLKLEFVAGGRQHALLEFDLHDGDSRHIARYRVRRASDKAEAVERELRMHTALLAMMRLEGRVTGKPFDE